MRLLVVEDSEIMRQSLVTGLQDAGYIVDSAADGEEGLWYVSEQDYDLIVLDIMLPKLNGFELLARLRDAGHMELVLLLTARDDVSDRVKGLRQGADDYLVKPFDFDELLARIEALLRRRMGAQIGSEKKQLQVGDLMINFQSKQVSVAEQLIDLPPREYALLECLALNRAQVVSRAEIEKIIYDDLIEPMSNVVDSAISNLRKNIDQPGSPSFIITRRGYGYQLREA